MKEIKLSVVFLTPAVLFFLLLTACSDGIRQGELATITISLGNSENSRQLVPLDGTSGTTKETHTYELSIDGASFKAFTPGTTFQVNAGSRTFEIRAYGIPTDIFITGSNLIVPQSIWDRVKVLRAIGSRSVTVKANQTTTVSIDLYSALDVSSWEELEWAVQDPQYLVSQGGGTRKETIILKNAIDMDANGTITIDRPIEIRAEGNVTITRASTFTGAFFNVNSVTGTAGTAGTAGKLAIGATLEGKSIGSAIILDGGRDSSTSGTSLTVSAPLIVSAGELTIGKDVTLQENSNDYTGSSSGTSGGSGVHITDGTFTLFGKISNNETVGSGGGVYVAAGTFVMEEGALIKGNTAKNGGGVYIATGTFTMNGGAITDNTATAEGGGVYMIGGIFNIKAAGSSYKEWVKDNYDPNTPPSNVWIDSSSTAIIEGGSNDNNGW